jgi:hypothetical protein
MNGVIFDVVPKADFRSGLEAIPQPVCGRRSDIQHHHSLQTGYLNKTEGFLYLPEPNVSCLGIYVPNFQSCITQACLAKEYFQVFTVTVH